MKARHRGKPEDPAEHPEESEYEVRAASAEREVVVETSLYRLVLSNRGARLLSMRLEEHLSNTRESYEMVGLGAAEHLNIRPLDLRLSSPRDTDAVSMALFETDAPRKMSVADGEEKTVSFRWSDGRGLAVEKHLTFLGATYRIHVEVSVSERGEEVGKQVLYGGGIGNEITESHYVGADKGVVVSRGEVELFTAQDVDEGSGTGVSVTATGVASHYFTGLMLPADDGLYASRFETGVVPTEDEKRAEREVITAALEAPTSKAVFTLYMGPKKLERLEALAPGMSEIIEFGWMRYPALLLRSGLLKIYAFVGNWGFAIVFLTVAINIVLVPLKHYSFVSMRRMQKLSPQIQKIRDRYKKVKPTDPRYQDMNKEIMTLYKENNASPLFRVSSDVADDPVFLRLLSPSHGVDRASTGPFHFPDSRPRCSRPVVRLARSHGSHANGHPEDDPADECGSNAAEDHVVHADHVHVHPGHGAGGLGAVLVLE